jgi:8-oxo-dGTP diphosphatase
MVAGGPDMPEIARVRTVSALLTDEQGKLVIQLRDNKPGLPFPNCWSTLGGRIEHGETPEQAIQRELVEEIEFCPPVRYWKTVDLQYQVRGNRMISEVSVFVGPLGRPVAEVRLREGQRLGSFGPDEIDGLACAFHLDVLFRDFFANGMPFHEP